MARPGETVGAAVFAAAIGVDGAVEGQIGRGHVVDDGARPLLAHLGPEQALLLGNVPAVILAFPLLMLEPAGRIGGGTARPEAQEGIGGRQGHGGNMEHMENVLQAPGAGLLPRRGPQVAAASASVAICQVTPGHWSH